MIIVQMGDNISSPVKSLSAQIDDLNELPPRFDTESVMCDVIKIRKKKKDERRSRKGNL